MTLLTEKENKEEENGTLVSFLPHNQELTVESCRTALSHPHSLTQSLLSSKLMPHVPEVGLNPLVDAASHLFSMMGRLIHLKSYSDLDQLYADLVQEVETFQSTIEAYTYKKEYIAEYAPIASYALCATLDEIITSTPWGGQDKWDAYRLVKTFIPEPPSQVSFFIILERLIRDPNIYIDVIELMYLCLSFGFKCRNEAGLAEFDHAQLEQITHSLYKRIRTHRGNFSKQLSPLSIKAASIPMPSFLDTHFTKIGVISIISCSLITALIFYFLK